MNLVLKIPVSSNQMIFALFFVILFTFGIVLMYRKDKSVHQVHYSKTARYTFLSFILFITVLFIIKFVLHQ